MEVGTFVVVVVAIALLLVVCMLDAGISVACRALGDLRWQLGNIQCQLNAIARRMDEGRSGDGLDS